MLADFTNSDAGLSNARVAPVDAAAPLAVGATSGGRLDLAEDTAGNLHAFVSVPGLAGSRTFRLLTDGGVPEYREIALSSQIETILSNNRLLVRSGNSYQIFDFAGRRRSQFTAGGLRFVFERPIGTDWYSYFSVSYRGRVDGEDYLFVRVYRMRTDRLGTMD